MESGGIRQIIYKYKQERPVYTMCTDEALLNIIFEKNPEILKDVPKAELSKIMKGSIFGAGYDSYGNEVGSNIEHNESKHSKLKASQKQKAIEIIRQESPKENVYKTTFQALQELGMDINSMDGKKIIERLTKLPSAIYQEENIGEMLIETMTKNDLIPDFNNIANAMESMGISIRTAEEEEQAKEDLQKLNARLFTQSLLIYMNSAASEMYAEAHQSIHGSFTKLLDFGFYADNFGKLTKSDTKSLSKHYAKWANKFEDMNPYNENEFKTQLKQYMGINLDEKAVLKNIDVLQNPQSKEFKKVYKEIFGYNALKDANTNLTITNITNGFGDAGIMIMTLGYAGEAKIIKAGKMLAAETSAAMGSKIAAKAATKSTKFGKMMTKLAARGARLVGPSVAGGFELGGFGLAKGTLGNITTANSGSDFIHNEAEAIKESISSFGLGFFGGVWGQTAVAKVVEKVTRTSARTAAELAPKFAQGSVDLSEVVTTYIEKSTPTKLAKGSAYLSEVVGFSLYESALAVLENIPNWQDMTVEDISNILWEQLNGQGVGLLEIKLAAMFIKGGRTAQTVSKNYLTQAKKYDGVKVREIKKNGNTEYVIEGKKVILECKDINEVITGGLLVACMDKPFDELSTEVSKTEAETKPKENEIKTEENIGTEFKTSNSELKTDNSVTPDMGMENNGGILSRTNDKISPQLMTEFEAYATENNLKLTISKHGNVVFRDSQGKIVRRVNIDENGEVRGDKVFTKTVTETTASNELKNYNDFIQYLAANHVSYDYIEINGKFIIRISDNTRLMNKNRFDYYIFENGELTEKQVKTTKDAMGELDWQYHSGRSRTLNSGIDPERIAEDIKAHKAAQSLRNTSSESELGNTAPESTTPQIVTTEEFAKHVGIPYITSLYRLGLVINKGKIDLSIPQNKDIYDNYRPRKRTVSTETYPKQKASANLTPTGEAKMGRKSKNTEKPKQTHRDIATPDESGKTSNNRDNALSLMQNNSEQDNTTQGNPTSNLITVQQFAENIGISHVNNVYRLQKSQGLIIKDGKIDLNVDKNRQIFETYRPKKKNPSTKTYPKQPTAKQEPTGRANTENKTNLTEGQNTSTNTSKNGQKLIKKTDYAKMLGLSESVVDLYIKNCNIAVDPNGNIDWNNPAIKDFTNLTINLMKQLAPTEVKARPEQTKNTATETNEPNLVTVVEFAKIIGISPSNVISLSGIAFYHTKVNGKSMIDLNCASVTEIVKKYQAKKYAKMLGLDENTVNLYIEKGNIVVRKDGRIDFNNPINMNFTRQALSLIGKLTNQKVNNQSTGSTIYKRDWTGKSPEEKLLDLGFEDAEDISICYPDKVQKFLQAIEITDLYIDKSKINKETSIEIFDKDEMPDIFVNKGGGSVKLNDFSHLMEKAKMIEKLKQVKAQINKLLGGKTSSIIDGKSYKEENFIQVINDKVYTILDITGKNVITKKDLQIFSSCPISMCKKLGISKIDTSDGLKVEIESGKDIDISVIQKLVDAYNGKNQSIVTVNDKNPKYPISEIYITDNSINITAQNGKTIDMHAMLSLYKMCFGEKSVSTLNENSIVSPYLYEVIEVIENEFSRNYQSQTERPANLWTELHTLRNMWMYNDKIKKELPKLLMNPMWDNTCFKTYRARLRFLEKVIISEDGSKFGNQKKLEDYKAIAQKIREFDNKIKEYLSSETLKLEKEPDKKQIPCIAFRFDNKMYGIGIGECNSDNGYYVETIYRTKNKFVF